MQRIKQIEIRKFYIYVLKDPNTLEIRYVGVTCTSLSSRLAQHIYDSKKSGTYKRNWIGQLLKNNTKPIIEIIEECTYLDYQEREIYWISFYDNLTNTDKGGNGVVTNRSKESIKKSSEAKFSPVVAIDINRNVFFYNSHKQASKETGVPRTSIEYSITNLNYSSYGFNFIKTSDYNESLRYKVRINPKKNKYNLIHNNITYTPIEFAEYLNVSETIVYLWCEGKQLWKNSYKFDNNEIKIIKI
jgi:hypothetical protein